MLHEVGGERSPAAARLAQYLKAALQRSALTRAEVAARFAVTEDTVRRWENGVDEPPPEQLAQLFVMLAMAAPDLSPLDPGTDDLPVLARRLRQERLHRGITQVEAAHDIGVAQATYAGWEVGRAAPARYFVPAVADFLGLSAVQLSQLADTPFVVDSSRWPPFGQLLGERRQALRLTRLQLASTIGVAEATLGAWELGHRTPRAHQLRSLATALEISVDQLEAVLTTRQLSGLGELIRLQQQRLGVPRQQIAARAHVDPATLSRWANGHSQPRPDSLRRLAAALDVSLQEVCHAMGLAPI